MHDLAVISTIKSIQPIEGKDRIVVANVENYNCIVNKEEFKVGDTVVYVFYDSILPVRPEFEFLRKRCWSEKWQGFRIRPMKLGGVISEGLVLPMSYLPKGDYKVGDVVTDKLGIRLYDPEEFTPAPEPKKTGLIKHLYKFKWFRTLMDSHRKRVRARELERSKYDSWTQKSDEENIEKVYDKVKDSERTFIVTEKIEGQAFLASWKKGKFKVFSHNRRVTSGNWWSYAQETHLERKMKEYCKYQNLDGIAIAGELIGPGIQQNIYNVKEFQLYLYGGYNLDGSPFTWQQLRDVAEDLLIPTVPLDREQVGVWTLEEMLKDCEGTSRLADVPREGLVYRSVDGKVHFKVKSRSYKIWFEKCKD